NTDVSGFLAPLAELRESIRDRSAVILGAGGAARAVLYACYTSLRPSQVTIVARTPARAEKMIEALSHSRSNTRMSVVTFDDAQSAVADAALIVNTTPVGTYPGVHATPWMHLDSFRSGQIVYDVVYNPLKTRLLRDAESRGATVLNGMEMLLAQAAAAHTLWTGLRMPVDEVRERILHELSRRHR
ncbi:MAG: shikimate dehydrogenase, partial [Rhodothermales bacterium]|nr:shikimate dehydrogenase [Rhodothermales bacterium]